MLLHANLTQLILQRLDRLLDLVLGRRIIREAGGLDNIVELLEDLVDVGAPAHEDLDTRFERGDAVFGFEFGGALRERFGAVGGRGEYGGGGGFGGFVGHRCGRDGAVDGGGAAGVYGGRGGLAVDFRFGGWVRVGGVGRSGPLSHGHGIGYVGDWRHWRSFFIPLSHRARALVNRGGVGCPAEAAVRIVLWCLGRRSSCCGRSGPAKATIRLVVFSWRSRLDDCFC
jgi:hypothetical protein